MLLIFVALLPAAAGLVVSPLAMHRRRASVHMAASRGASSCRVRVETDEAAVGIALCDIVEAAYAEYAASPRAEERRFTFLISGGSMLKMLTHLKEGSSVDWSRCTMGFVSHRCVPLDSDGSTYHKAGPLFLDAWVAQGLRVLAPTGSADAEREAELYEAALRDAAPQAVTRSDGAAPKPLPCLDLVLVGMGLDGHCGSIYPNIPGVESTRLVVAITGTDGMGLLSTKLSLSLAAMRAARRTVVACAGKSAKAPLGKAQAMVRALEAEETAMTFPAS